MKMPASQQLQELLTGCLASCELPTVHSTLSRLDVLRLTELSAMTGDNELSSTAAKDVFMELLVSTESPRAIAEAKNLLAGQ